MKKELKFRVWDKKKKLIYFVEQIDFNGQQIQINTGERIRNENKGDGIIVLDGRKFVAMQYTGLKDKNGKDIFEGDILRGWCKGLYEIKWLDGNSYSYVIGFIRDQFKKGQDNCIETSDMKTTKTIWGRCEIIGNIHENQETIKQLNV